MAESAGAGGPREWSAAQGGGQTEAGGGCQEALGGCGALMGCRMGGWMSREWGWLGGGSRGEAGGMERCPPHPLGRSVAGKWSLGAVGLGKQMDDAVVSGAILHVRGQCRAGALSGCPRVLNSR